MPRNPLPAPNLILVAVTGLAVFWCGQMLTIADGPAQDDPDIPFVFGFDFVEVQDQQAAADNAQQPAAKGATQQNSDDAKGATHPDGGAENAGGGEAAGEGNPLARQLIRGLFNNVKPSGRILGPIDDAELIPLEYEAGMRDAIDALAPVVTKVNETLARARQTMDAGKPDLAMDLLQQVLDYEEDSLVRTKAGRAVSTRLHANRLLARLGSDLLETYELKHGASARQLLDQARSRGDIGGMVEVGSRYLHTEAGREAADQLGTLHLDRGEFGMASHWFAMLWEFQTEQARDPRWRTKAALAFREAGRLQEMQQVLDADAPEKLTIAGAEVRHGEWLDSQPALGLPEPETVEDWLTLYGDSDRTAKVAGGTPVLLPRWQVPLTDNLQIQQQVRDLSDDLMDEQRAVISTLQPITVNGRIAIRTLRGVQLVDVESGRRLWQTREGWSAERLLTGESPNDGSNGNSFRIANGVLIRSYQGTGADGHQLTSLLMRNGVYGLPSSDGRRLFVLEEHCIFPAPQRRYSPFARTTVESDKLGRDWSTNMLVAYDLTSGRPVWEVGGQQMGEQLDLALAGYSFYGVPTLDGGELLIVGENAEREIRLFALNPETGAQNWSQLIGYCETAISEDRVRRWWLSQVAVHDGVVVAPTTTGWLVAIDRLNHSMLWAYRYSTPDRNQQSHSSSRKKNVAEQMALNNRWLPAAPIVADRYVVYTPSEESAVVCVDLFTGELKWRAPKSNYLYLAGVFDQKVLLVGKSAVAALDLTSGTTVWVRAIEGSSGMPSGRGVAVGENYLLPLTGGRLQTIRISDGKVTNEIFQAAGSPPLGNLIMYRGLLLSLSQHGLTAYEQREPLREQIELAERQETPPAQRAQSLLLSARLQRLDQAYVAAVDTLRQIDADQLQPESRRTYRSLMFDCLAELISAEAENSGQLLEEIRDWADTREQSMRQRMLAARHYRRTGQQQQAIEHYLELIAEVDAGGLTDDGTLEPHDQNRLQVQSEFWIAGQLEDLWTGLDDTHRQQLTAAIRQQIDAAETRERQLVVLRRFAFHPLISSLQLRMAEQSLSDGELGEAHFEVDELVRQKAPEAPRAQQLLIEALIAAGLAPEARRQLQLLEQQPSETLLNGDETVAAFATRIRSLPDWERLSSQPRSEWTSSGSEIQTTGANYNANAIKLLDTEHLRSPTLTRFQYELNQNLNRLTLSQVDTGEIFWSIPLRGTSSHGMIPTLYESGLYVILMLRDTIYCLSPVERRVVWTSTHDIPQSSQSHRYYGSPNDDREMFFFKTDLLRYHSLRSHYGQNNSAGVLNANERWVCCRDRRGFRLLDVRDGQTLWSYSGMGPNCDVHLLQDYLLAIRDNWSEIRVFRTTDGRPVEVNGLLNLTGQAVAIHENSLLLLEDGGGFSLFGLGGSRPTLRLHDPFTGQTAWKIDLRTDTGLSLQPDGQLLMVSRGNRISSLQIATGEQQQIANVDGLEAEDGNRTVAVTDRHNLYLFATDERDHNSFYSEIRTIPVSGQVFCIDRATGETRWTQEIDSQHLTVSGFSSSPVLLLSKTQYERKGNIQLYAMQLKAYDKRNGQLWAEYRLPTSGFQGITFNLPERYVEVRTYNARIRMKSVEQQASQQSAVD